MPGMTKERSRLAAILLLTVAAMTGPLPSMAADEETETPSEMAREGMDRMLRAIELMIEMIPQYEMPEVLENGDIIIRRANPSTDDPDDVDPDADPDVEETNT